MRKTITFSKTGTSHMTRKLREAASSPLKKLFIAAGAAIDQESGLYTLNNITNISEEQMLIIYTNKEAIYRLDLPQTLRGSSARTIIPCSGPVKKQIGNRRLNGMETFAASSIEVLKFGCEQELESTSEENLLPAGTLQGTFGECSKLHTIFPIDMSEAEAVSNDTFKGCQSLQEARLYGLKCSISLVDSPLISHASLLYTVTNCKASIEIALHPDTYKYLLTMNTAPESVGGTKEDWAALQQKATGSSVRFTTPQQIIFISNGVMQINHVTIQEETLIIDNSAAEISDETIIFGDYI